MPIHSLLIPKELLKTVSTNDTLSTALTIMEDNNKRCLPILDISNTLYRGNIYKYHIYQHVFRGGSLSDSVTTLLKNATKFILDTDSFFTTFFTLSDLPYISVLNTQHHFLGIIRHEDVMTMLSQSWQLTNASYALTIELPNTQTDIKQLLKIIKKYSDVQNIMTFNKNQFANRYRTIITLPKSFDVQLLDVLIKKLTIKHFSVIDIEDLTKGI